MATFKDLLDHYAGRSGWSIKNNEIYIATSNPYNDYRHVIDYDITQMWPETMIDAAYEYWKRDEEDTEKLYKNLVDAKWDKERTIEMANERVIMNEVKKMAERYGLIVEINRTYVADKLSIEFNSKDYTRRKAFEIFDLMNRDTRCVLESIERDLIRAFKIDLNKFEPIKVPRIEDVIFNDPATIVFWEDNTKTVFKCQEDDLYDPEKGLAMAISKKALGNQGNYCNTFKKWLPEGKTVEAVYLTNPCKSAGEAIEAIKKVGKVIREFNKEK